MRVRGRPRGSGHLFNPPTHRHEKGCLTASTVLRLKFSKKIHRFPGGAFFSYPYPFKKKFPKKIFIYFPEGSLFFISIFYFLFSFSYYSSYYYRFIKQKK